MNSEVTPSAQTAEGSRAALRIVCAESGARSLMGFAHAARL